MKHADQRQNIHHPISFPQEQPPQLQLAPPCSASQTLPSRPPPRQNEARRARKQQRDKKKKQDKKKNRDKKTQRDEKPGQKRWFQKRDDPTGAKEEKSDAQKAKEKFVKRSKLEDLPEGTEVEHSIELKFS